MTSRKITINAKAHEIEADDEMPLLWVLRDLLGMTGTKYGCGVGVCGACTILQNGNAVRACQVPFREAAGKDYITIEGLSADGKHPVQQAWLTEDVAQCGYCQPGMMMQMCSLLRQKPAASADEIDAALSDHVCRCGSYPRIRKAALLAAKNGSAK